MVRRDWGAPDAPGCVAHPPNALDDGRPCQGHREGKVLRWEFETEPEALRMLDCMLHAEGAGQWREHGSRGPRRLSRERRPFRTRPE